MSNKKMKKVSSNWDYLPEHLLEDILDRFVEVSDYVRFSVVCKRWLSTAQFHLKQWRLKSSSSPQKQTPMLLIQSRGSIKKQRLHSVVVRKHQLLMSKAADLHVPDYMYNDINIRSCGSSHGWLIFIREDTLALILYNPFTRSTINLPPIFDIPKHVSATLTSALERFKTVVLSEDPSLHPDTYQVLVLYDSEFIWLFRSRSDSWVRVKKPQIPQNPDADIYDLYNYSNIPHAIYYRGKFYIAGKRFIIIVETNDEECCAIYRHLGFQQLISIAGNNIRQQYIVELCNGCLLYIERVAYALRMFHVYELDVNHEDGPMCSLVPSLGGETLFLGFNYSFSLSASACKPDCIYYTGHDDLCNTGVYYVRRERTKHLNHPSINHRRANVPATWIVPQPNLNTSYL